MKHRNFEVSMEITKAKVLTLTEEQFLWLPEDTKAERDLKSWILASVRRIIANPSLAKSFVNCFPSNDGERHTSRQHASSASQYGLDFWNSTNHGIGLEWAIDIAENKEKALDRLAHKKDMASGVRVVRDYDNPNILYLVGGWRDVDYKFPPSYVIRVSGSFVNNGGDHLVPALSHSA